MKKEKILIVEDETMIAEVLGDIVAAMGMTSIWAAHGAEALEYAEKDHFDLVIMDLELPEMPGTEVAMKLLEFDPALKIIYSTGYSEHEDRIDHSHPSTVAVIKKPYEIADIKAVIEKGVNSH